jgi:hypothetical protein
MEREIARVGAMWLVAVKEYGAKPHRLLIRIRVKIETIIAVRPVLMFGPAINLNSKCIVV